MNGWAGRTGAWGRGRRSSASLVRPAQRERAAGYLSTMNLSGRTALVTGAGHRIGRAIAVALGGRGMRVAVHYNAAAEGARETVKQIEAAGGEADIISADLIRPDSAPGLIGSVVATFGSLDVLVTSAAVMLRMPFGSITPQQWDDVM